MDLLSGPVDPTSAAEAVVSSSLQGRGGAAALRYGGRMFWFIRKKFLGSYFRFTSCNRL